MKWVKRENKYGEESQTQTKMRRGRENCEKDE